MNLKKKTAIIALLAASLALTACGKQTASEPDSSAAEVEVTTAEETTEEVTEAPTNAAFPEADPNACTFDEVGEDIAVIVVDDDTAADGTLSIEDVDGNKMLKFTDNTTNADNLADAVQKMRFDVTKLLAPEQLPLVNSIEFDICAKAKDTLYVNEDGENSLAPGWIGGGGGSECADGKWYGFSDFSVSGAQEYVLERSDLYHVTFKFVLAASGKCWSEEMTEPYFQIMRWGMGNLSDTYIDNITFFDADGNSIPLTVSEGWATAGEEDAAANNEDAGEETIAENNEAASEEANEENVEVFIDEEE